MRLFGVIPDRVSPKMRQFNRKHDVLFWYSKSDKWAFNPDSVRVPHKKPIGAGGTSAKWQKSASENLAEKYQKGKIPETWWADFSPVGRIKTERVGYPTQKPLALLERIIKASSNKDEVVFDPFCGCATTLVAADRLQRDWIGIDISGKAAELVVERIKADQGLFQEIIARTDIPKRMDLGDIPRYNAPKNKTLLYGEQGGDCNGCGTHFQKQHLEVDHIIAENVGGTDHIENLQLLCSHCNRIKGDRGQEYLISRLNKD